ncbi:MAG TPA: (d)CMP kinase [Patescibacteria group bacterium]|nr:(d)CMP kinase [Patescibacteria group bacterium]
MIIAIDGPAGAGKSTVAKLLAGRLGFLYIDTGAMYRALTLKALDEGVDAGDEAALEALAGRTTIALENTSGGALQVLLDGRDVSVQIREPRITKYVSQVAKVKGVREVMVGLQRSLGRRHSSVMDGRDIGTVVFPAAEKKFYLDASVEERVNRRYKELQPLNRGLAREEVARDLTCRDTIDSTRECGPLKKADDAVYVDTTRMTITEVVDTLYTLSTHG